MRGKEEKEEKERERGEGRKGGQEKGTERR